MNTSFLHLILCASFIALISIDPSLKASEDDHNHGHIKAAHGGTLLEVGHHIAFIELVHDLKQGRISLYLMDHDGKDMGVSDAPRLNLSYQAGKANKKKQLICKAINLKHGHSHHFEADDDLLKTENFGGKIAIKIMGKNYQVELAHDHDHDGHGHHGHDH